MTQRTDREILLSIEAKLDQLVHPAPVADIASLLSYAWDETAESNVEVAGWLQSLRPSIRVDYTHD